MPLHPQAQTFVDQLAKMGAPSWETMTPSQARELFETFKEFFGESPELAKVEDYRVADDIPIRVYKPSEQSRLPVAMYFHGGGWVLGNLDTHDSLCRRLAINSGCAVVAVDYRLAPEHKYPAAHDDCFAATRYVSERADELELDASRLAVMGDSAGGNLATTVALRARDQGGPVIRFQLLIYPVIEPKFDTTSYQELADGYGLTRAAMQWFWQQYLSDGSSETDPLAVPSKADDLSGLPDAHVLTAEYDVLRDEGEAYAELLRSAGVATTTRRYEGTLHGFVHNTGLFDDGVTAGQEIGDLLRQALR